MTWNSSFTKGIQKFQRTIEVSKPGYVVYAGDLTPSNEHCSAIHFSQISSIFNT